jgi:hypothetical protein
VLGIRFLYRCGQGLVQHGDGDSCLPPSGHQGRGCDPLLGRAFDPCLPEAGRPPGLRWSVDRSIWSNEKSAGGLTGLDINAIYDKSMDPDDCGEPSVVIGKDGIHTVTLRIAFFDPWVKTDEDEKKKKKAAADENEGKFLLLRPKTIYDPDPTMPSASSPCRGIDVKDVLKGAMEAIKNPSAAEAKKTIETKKMIAKLAAAQGSTPEQDSTKEMKKILSHITS